MNVIALIQTTEEKKHKVNKTVNKDQNQNLREKNYDCDSHLSKNHAALVTNRYVDMLHMQKM